MIRDVRTRFVIKLPEFDVRVNYRELPSRKLLVIAHFLSVGAVKFGEREFSQFPARSD